MWKAIAKAYQRRALRARRLRLSEELTAIYDTRHYMNQREKEIVREAKKLDAEELQHSLLTRRARAW